VKKGESQPETDKIKPWIGIELPEGDYELLKEEDKEAIRSRYEDSKDKIKELIQTFYEKGYRSGAAYLENLSDRLFTHISNFGSRQESLLLRPPPCWKGSFARLAVVLRK
jgi:hypothetical protein